MTAAWAASCTLALICLAWILLGPAPRYGTRWYWFWTSMAPLGLGVLAWLWRERPWLPVTASGRPDPGAEELEDADEYSEARGGAGDAAGVTGVTARRRSGGQGMLALIAMGIVIGLAWALADSLLGSDLVPVWLG
jgi:hypothetical protein